MKFFIWLFFIVLVWLFIRGTDDRPKKRFMVPAAIRYPWYIRLYRFLFVTKHNWS